MPFGTSAAASYGAGMRISDIVNTVPVMNRFQDAEVELTHDGEGVTWRPGQVRHLPPDYANWFLRKSSLKKNRKGQSICNSLVIVGSGKDESSLLVANFEGRRELIDRSTGPTTGFDTDGTPMTAKIIEVDGVAGVDQREQQVVNREVSQHQVERAANEAETGRKVEAVIEENPFTDEQIDRAARLISEGKSKAAEAGQIA